jgi:hypothetical protein
MIASGGRHTDVIFVKDIVGGTAAVSEIFMVKDAELQNPDEKIYQYFCHS